MGSCQSWDLIHAHQEPKPVPEHKVDPGAKVHTERRRHHPLESDLWTKEQVIAALKLASNMHLRASDAWHEVHES